MFLVVDTLELQRGVKRILSPQFVRLPGGIFKLLGKLTLAGPESENRLGPDHSRP
jgi:hypothetical protein